jgi:two-component system phosphate regulon sensor histidine kinase PhoR
MKLTFRTKLLASHVGLVVAVVLIALLELNRSLVADLHRQLDVRLEQQALGAAQWIGEGRRHPDKLAGRLALVVSADVTIFDPAGAVVGDSTAGGAEPGAGGAPEVTAARHGNVGRSSRTKPSTGDEMHYVAVPAADGLVLRLAAPLSEINATVLSLRRRLALASLLALAAALGLGVLAAQLAARPLRAMTASATRIAQGDYDIDVPSATPDEFGILSRALGSLAAELKAKIGDLTAERDRLSAILSGMAEGVIVIGKGGSVVVANPAAEQILGANASLVGRTLSEAVLDERLRGFIERAARSEETGEAEIETPHGRTIAVYVRSLAAAAGGYVTVLRDLTRVRKLMTVRRDFVANVSHELRTPVAAIQGYAETLLRGATDQATTKQFLEVVHRQAQRIGALVQDLLTLSELEARPADQTKRVAVDVGAVAANVRQTVRERAGALKGDVTLKIPTRLHALGDQTALEQVLENLVDNAMKYGKEGGAIVVEGELRAGRVIVSVVDEGPGIDPEHLPRLFERFYRVDGGRSRDRGGTGLGLSIVKHLVESMGGTISVRSEAGKGSRFGVDLPAAL